MEVRIVEQTEECDILNIWGRFKLRVFRVEHRPEQFATVSAIYLGDLDDDAIVRINGACITSESFGDTHCDCKWQLDEAFRMITEAGNGLILYTPDEGRGIGLFHKVRTMRLQQNQGYTTAGAFRDLGFHQDERNYQIAKPILRWFGLKKIRLISNNPDKIELMAEAGLEVTEVIPVAAVHFSHLLPYLRSKRDEFGHLIVVPDDPVPVRAGNGPARTDSQRSDG
ncbi:MAG: GTP cyclohydrolase II RibA [Rhizobiaceae bacterium]|nr:GTP cyclohydrolase II RibA [Rhizobiaceae bacterium]